MHCVVFVCRVKVQSSAHSQVAGVLLAHHRPRLSQHYLRRRRVSPSTAVPHRLSLYEPIHCIFLAFLPRDDDLCAQRRCKGAMCFRDWQKRINDSTRREFVYGEWKFSVASGSRAPCPVKGLRNCVPRSLLCDISYLWRVARSLCIRRAFCAQCCEVVNSHFTWDGVLWSILCCSCPADVSPNFHSLTTRREHSFTSEINKLRGRRR